MFKLQKAGRQIERLTKGGKGIVILDVGDTSQVKMTKVRRLREIGKHMVDYHSGGGVVGIRSWEKKKSSTLNCGNWPGGMSQGYGLRSEKGRVPRFRA